MKSRSTLTVVASLFAAALIVLPSAHASDAFEEDFPAASEAAVEIPAGELADLERAFWICDYEATHYGVGMEESVACADVYEGLKRVKFDGDFDELVQWWSANKPEQHAALDRARVAHANAARESAEVFPDSI